MAATGLSPGLIASIVVILIIALVLIVLYFMCRSDDPARDHTCVAILYPSSRRELRQLRIPLDPLDITDMHENAGYEEEKERNDGSTESHSVQLHVLERKEENGTTEKSTQRNNVDSSSDIADVSLQSTQVSTVE